MMENRTQDDAPPQPGFYAWRKPLIVAACVAPLFLAGLLWLLVNRILLAPSFPGPTAAAAQFYEFMADERGLPRLSASDRMKFVETIATRAAKDPKFTDDFLAAMKESAKDQQARLRSNLVNAFLDTTLSEVRRYNALSAAEQPAFLDDRIVEHKRDELLFRRIHIDKEAISSEKGDLLQMVLTRTTDAERQMAMAYAGAMQARVREILDDDNLKKKFEERVGAPLP